MTLLPLLPLLSLLPSIKHARSWYPYPFFKIYKSELDCGLAVVVVAVVAVVVVVVVDGVLVAAAAAAARKGSRKVKATALLLLTQLQLQLLQLAKTLSLQPSLTQHSEAVAELRQTIASGAHRMTYLPEDPLAHCCFCQHHVKRK